MASLLEHVSLNKLTDQLGEAIASVGGDVSDVDSPFDYPDIIKDQLSAGVGGGNIINGNGIIIEKDGPNYKISANADATLIRDLNPSHNLDDDANVDIIPAGTSIQKTLEIIVNDVFPTLPSLIKGDFIKSDENGSDQYQNPNYPTPGKKTGLDPLTTYLRLFVVSRKEPIYVSCKPLGDIGGDELPEYVGEDTSTVDIDIKDGKITANVIGLGDTKIYESNIDPSLLDKINRPVMEGGEVDKIFDDIFG